MIQKTVDAAKPLNPNVVVKSGNFQLDAAAIDWLEGVYRRITERGFKKLEVWSDLTNPTFPEDDVFRLCINSSPKQVGKLRGAQTFKGYTLSGGTLSTYSGTGVPITDNRCVGAELVGNNKVFVLFPCVNRLNSQERDVLTWIISSSLDVIALSPKERQRRQSEGSQHMRSKEELEFIDAVCGYFDGSLIKIRKQIAEKQKLRDELVNRLVLSRKALTERSAALEAATALRNQAQQQLSTDILRIRQNQLIQEMIPYGGGLVLTTWVLSAFSSETGNTHEIGKFRLELYPTVADPQQAVKWYNLSRVVEINGQSFYAPNVSATGIHQDAVAYGNLVRLVQNFELSAAVDEALALLANPSRVSQETLAAFARNIQHWPAM